MISGILQTGFDFILLVTVVVLTCSCSAVYSVSLLNKNSEH